MVSLTRSFNTNSGGATFFSESVNMDDRQYLIPTLESHGTFKTLRIIPAVIMHIIFALVTVIEATIYCVLWLVGKEKEHGHLYFGIFYLQCTLWFLTLVLSMLMHVQHSALRLNGYLDFYSETISYSKLPFYLVSAISVIMFLITQLFEQILESGETLKVPPIAFIGPLLLVEIIVILIDEITYIAKVWKFNKQKPVPDVCKQEWISSATNTNFARNEVGYRDLADNVTNFLEKQAALIEYLKEHNSRLSRKLVVLTSELQAARRPLN